MSIVTPLDGSEYLEGEVIAMEILASDDGVVDRIELFSNGVLINEFTQAPYRYEWSNVPVGSYGLTAVAYDDQLNSSSSQPVTIVVCPDADGDGACDEFVPPPPPPPADAPVLLTLSSLTMENTAIAMGRVRTVTSCCSSLTLPAAKHFGFRWLALT